VEDCFCFIPTLSFCKKRAELRTDRASVDRIVRDGDVGQPLHPID
jgi:hypothetical protein